MCVSLWGVFVHYFNDVCTYDTDSRKQLNTDNEAVSMIVVALPTSDINLNEYTEYFSQIQVGALHYTLHTCQIKVFVSFTDLYWQPVRVAITMTELISFH